MRLAVVVAFVVVLCAFAVLIGVAWHDIGSTPLPVGGGD